MIKIILIGRCCRISFDFISLSLKQETSLFEWTWTDTLSEINFIIRKIINNEKINIIRIDGNDFFEGTNIKTSHYIDKDYESIVLRRRQRLIDNILSNDEILFVRDDVLHTIQKQEIEDFFSLIKTINPSVSCKMLLLSDLESFTIIEHPNLIHKKYDKSQYLTYIEDICKSKFENNS